jgi:hypothetical protein
MKEFEKKQERKEEKKERENYTLKKEETMMKI